MRYRFRLDAHSGVAYWFSGSDVSVAPIRGPGPGYSVLISRLPLAARARQLADKSLQLCKYMTVEEWLKNEKSEC